jgi:hypothetical protein
MSSTKLTPLEVLQRQKLRLQVKSEALTDTLEENLNYLQHNIGALLGNSAVTAVVSKTPPFVQDLLGRGERLSDGEQPGTLLSIAEAGLDFLPLFLKGPKGFVAKLVLRQLKKIFFKNN